MSRSSAYDTWMRAPEFQVTHPTAETVDLYTESHAGARWRLATTETSASILRSNELSGHLYVDGKHVRKELYHKIRTVARARYQDGVKRGQNRLLPFLFGKVGLTDDQDRATNDESVVKNTGTISFRLYRVKRKQKARRRKEQLPTASVLHEQAKKAQIDHSTSFGISEQGSHRQAMAYINTEYIDHEKSPFETFNIHYRSGQLLEALEIKPASAMTATQQPVAQQAGEKRKEAPHAQRQQQPAPKKEKLSAPARKATQVIEIDSSDEESELQRLRRQNAKLESELKRVKRESNA